MLGFDQSFVPTPAMLAPSPAFVGPVVKAFPSGHVDEDVKEPVPPGQILTPVVAGVGFIDITAVAVLLQLFTSVPVTVYVVNATGLAVTVAPVVADNPVAGVQLYIDAPLAVSDMPLPLQMVAEAGVTLMVGNALTVIVTVVVFMHPLTFVPITE